METIDTGNVEFSRQTLMFVTLAQIYTVQNMKDLDFHVFFNWSKGMTPSENISKLHWIVYV